AGGRPTPAARPSSYGLMPMLLGTPMTTVRLSTSPPESFTGLYSARAPGNRSRTYPSGHNTVEFVRESGYRDECARRVMELPAISTIARTPRLFAARFG